MVQTKAVQLLGVKRFKGDIEGKSFDSCKLIALMGFDPASSDAVGAESVELPFGKSENFSKASGLKFPGLFDIDVVEYSRGGRAQTVVVDVRPRKS